MGKPKKKCSTCMHYQPSPVRGQGWCRNPSLRKPHERSLVGAGDLACDKKFYDFWEPPARPEAAAPAPPARSTGLKPAAATGSITPENSAPTRKPIRTSRLYLYASGVLLLLLIGLGSLLLLSGKEPEPVVQVESTPLAAFASVPTVTATPTITPTATVVAPPTPTTSAPALLEVANTERQGVFLRGTPAMADRLRAWPEGTVLEIIGPDREAEGVVWKQVKDPEGNEGWVPAQYVKPKE